MDVLVRVLDTSFEQEALKQLAEEKLKEIQSKDNTVSNSSKRPPRKR